jgi:hypothetical protein
MKSKRRLWRGRINKKIVLPETGKGVKKKNIMPVIQTHK